MGTMRHDQQSLVSGMDREGNAGFLSGKFHRTGGVAIVIRHEKQEDQKKQTRKRMSSIQRMGGRTKWAGRGVRVAGSGPIGVEEGLV